MGETVTTAKFQESVEFQRGRNGERIIARWLQARGWYVIPSYDYSGEDGNKAPKLQGLRCGYPVPDLDIACKGKRLWAEVKTKTEPTLFRLLDRLEHGIEHRHFIAYHEVQEITGCQVWLFIYEERAGVVLSAALDDLSKRARWGSPSSRSTARYRGSAMVYFPRDAFRLVAQLGPDMRFVPLVDEARS